MGPLSGFLTSGCYGYLHITFLSAYVQEHQRACLFFFFLSLLGVWNEVKMFAEGYVSFTHWGYHIFQCKVCLFVCLFFIEELELNLLISKFKGFYTSISLRKQPTFCDIATGFPVKWCLRNQHRNSILMTCHYPFTQTFNQSEALPRLEFWRVISIGFLHWFLRHRFAGNQ